MTRAAQERWAACSAYEMGEPQTIQRILRRHPGLVPVLADLPAALARWFPDAPLRLDVEGAGLVVMIGVPDPLEALCGPLLDFDRAWWYAMVPRCAGRLTVDVEGGNA